MSDETSASKRQADPEASASDDDSAGSDSETGGEDGQGEADDDSAANAEADATANAAGADSAASTAGCFDLSVRAVGSPRAARSWVESESCIWRRTFDENGEETERTRLTNFRVWIDAVLVHRDGDQETGRTYELTALYGKRLYRGRTIAAELFKDLPRWLPKCFPIGLGIHPATPAVVDEVQHAIRQMNRHAPERPVFSHTGLAKVGGTSIYAHAGGAIGADEVITKLPDALAPVRLVPGSQAETAHALGRVRDLLDVAPKRMTAPLFCAVWRAILGGTNFAVWLFGGTRTGKTSLAALAQAFFGAGFNRSRLPSSFQATRIHNQGLAYVAKDMLVVVDDYHPIADPRQAAEQKGHAGELIRAQGNLAGRGRAAVDGSLLASRPPRGMLLITGEDLPDEPSELARLVPIEVRKDDVNLDRVFRCQADAAEGCYATLTAAFVQWYLEDVEGTQALFAHWRDEVGPEFERERPLAGENLSQLHAAYQVFDRFLSDRQLMKKPERHALSNEIKQALLLGDGREQIVSVSDPADTFLAQLGAVIGAKGAYLADFAGGPPEGFEAACGWVADPGGYPPWRAPANRPQVGWIDGNDLYLNPDVAYQAARTVGPGVTLTRKMIARALRDSGQLLNWDRTREVLTVRRTVENARREVWWLAIETLGIGVTPLKRVRKTPPTDQESDPTGA
jgi:hypothetical protein